MPDTPQLPADPPDDETTSLLGTPVQPLPGEHGGETGAAPYTRTPDGQTIWATDPTAPTAPAAPVVEPAAPVIGPASTAGAASTGMSGTTATATASASQPAPGARPGAGTPQLGRPAMADPRPAARMRTMVFGLILLVVAGAVLVGQLTSANVDPGVLALALMVGAGLLLVAGSRRAHD